MPRKYLTSVIVLFVVGLVLNFLMYRLAMGGALQADRVAEVPAAIEPLVTLAEAVFVLAFVWVWAHGMDPSKGALGQGLRYGLAVGFMTFVPGALLIGAMVPGIATEVLLWTIVAGEIKLVAMGVVLALVHPPVQPSTPPVAAP